MDSRGSIDEYRELWTHPGGRYALWPVPNAPGQYVIIDQELSQAVLIEDEDTAAAVVARMLKASVPVLGGPIS
jgi:hypothetical protein